MIKHNIFILNWKFEAFLKNIKQCSVFLEDLIYFIKGTEPGITASQNFMIQGTGITY